MKNKKRALILGGGIAGAEAAIAFRRKGFEVELVSDRDHLFIYPISIWIPVGTMKYDDASIALDKLARRHGFTLTVDRVTALDGERRRVTLENGGERSEADVVVVALGAAKIKYPGMEHARSICACPENSLILKEKVDAIIARGSGKIAFGFGGNPKDKSAVRGGPAFELFFNLHHKLKKLGIRDRYEMTFFAPMPQPGARMGQKALDAMDSMFRANNFKTRYGKKITGFDEGGVNFEDGSRLESDFTMFISALDGHPVIRASNLALNPSGFIQIDDYCRIQGVENWYAIGDSAALEGPEWKAKQGHLAETMAVNAAHNAAIAVKGAPGEPKGYQEHLNILCVMDIGNGAGFVYADGMKEIFFPMPIVGHWLKHGWAHYYRFSKLGRMLRTSGV
ncbi:FAD-dependent oxidoreductase [Chlorobium sp. N1]|uniref:NAD(P)/FAD-dependent oxidoreductase n=1 Tax=Chlorobium sp. N1 TaxID=2491138 RepID=UPI00103DF615|nr:FAD-dependent oxidoreductase [Chlorobium sp. N1]TCD47450.1 sulfide:quinone reductase [Chlorobium sp. N1]